MQFKLIFSIFLILIIPNLVSALGVSPGVIEIDFQPNLATSFDMTVYNIPAKNQDVEIYVSFAELDSSIIEEFRNVITLEKKNLSFIESEDKKTLKVNINLPAGFSISGIHELRVGAIRSSTREGEISIVAGNEVRILISVPEEYASNKFAKIKKLKILNVYAEDVAIGEKSKIEVLVKSESDVSLQNIYGKIKVLQEGQEIKTLETNKINLEPGQEGTLETEFEAKRVKAGILILDVEVFYDSKSEKSQGTLQVFEFREPGEEITSKKGGFPWWIFIIILLVIIIILLIFLLLKKKETQQIKQVQQ